MSGGVCEIQETGDERERKRRGGREGARERRTKERAERGKTLAEKGEIVA